MPDHLVERWRKPIALLAVEHDPDTAVRFHEGDGWYEGVSITTDLDGYQRIKDGQVCINCYEPQPPPAPNPVPDKCGLCGFPMREQQRRRFEIEFRGAKRVGPSTSLKDELDRLDEETAPRIRWERDPTIGILVPKGVS